MIFISDNIVLVGIAVVFVGIMLVIIGSLGGAKNVKVGIGGFIGPIPFGWANDPKMLPWIIAITIVIAAVFLLLALKGAGAF